MGCSELCQSTIYMLIVSDNDISYSRTQTCIPLATLHNPFDLQVFMFFISSPQLEMPQRPYHHILKECIIVS